MRVAIYARVSTDDGGQDPENQLAQLRAWCAISGHEIIAEYVDHGSGAKGADKRQQLAAMFDAAHRRRFDMVLVWALDRLSREGMIPTINQLQRLAVVGVLFHSYTEPLLSTDNDMVRDIVIAVMSSMAKMERQRVSERTKAGLQRARAKGRRLGRAPFSTADQQKLRMALDKGLSWHAASVATSIPYSTVRKHARLMGYAPRENASWSRSLWLVNLSAPSPKNVPPGRSQERQRVQRTAKGPVSITPPVLNPNVGPSRCSHCDVNSGVTGSGWALRAVPVHGCQVTRHDSRRRLAPACIARISTWWSQAANAEAACPLLRNPAAEWPRSARLSHWHVQRRLSACRT
jgi:DNA invertase Pin-like site-specific DNA recombinase